MSKEVNDFWATVNAQRAIKTGSQGDFDRVEEYKKKGGEVNLSRNDVKNAIQGNDEVEVIIPEHTKQDRMSREKREIWDSFLAQYHGM